MTINVTDVNEAPEVTGDAEKDYPENQTRDVATYRATDPEGGTIYWSLADEDVTGVDGIETDDEDDFSHFSISGRGVLTFNIPPDYEEGKDSRETTADNVYNIVVVASDDAPGAVGERMGYKKVVVTVTDVPEPGMVTLSSLQPQVDVGLTATLADSEVPSPSPTETWKWEKSRRQDLGLGDDRRCRSKHVLTGRYHRRQLPAGDGDL